MNTINSLLRELISKKNNLRVKSFEHERTFKTCSNILKNFHALTIDPNQVKVQLEDLCFKLDIHSLDQKSKHLRLLSNRVIQLCDDYLDKDSYLLSHSVILFLIEIHESMIHGSYEANFMYTEDDNLETFEIIDWGHLLRYSDDIVSMTRNDYDYDSDVSSDYSFDKKERIQSILNNAIESITTDIVKYDLITDCQYSINDLELECQKSIQSEYWMDNANCHIVSQNSIFINSFENYLSVIKPEYYKSQSSLRVAMTEYQFVREVIDVLLGASTCTIWKLHVDPINIAGNRYSVSKTCKLLNLSWAAFDNLSSSLAVVATNCLHMRVVSAHIIENSSRLTIAPPLIALGEQLYNIHSEFAQQVRQLENCARGGVGLSVLELRNSLTTWERRFVFLDDLIMCVTTGRFDSLKWHSTVVAVLDLLYNLMNESCLLAIDPWTVSCVHQLFFHCFRPYLFSLDALLCGQTHLSSTNLFLDRNESVSTDDLHHYYQHNFTIRKTTTQSLVTTIPIVLHPFIVQLISTITSIDVLRLLSIELTKPGIVNTIVKDPGSFINHFNATEHITESRDSSDQILIRQFNADTCPGTHPLSRNMFLTLVASLTRHTNHLSFTTPHIDQGDLVSACRRLHHTLLVDISDRYQSVNNHLMSVCVKTLGLDTTLDTIRSVYFLQAGVEMYDLCSHLFQLLITHGHIDHVAQRVNHKLQQVLSDSTNLSLRQEAKRLIVRISTDGETIVNECERMIAVISSFTIHYNVPWALKLIITEPLLHTCNTCLRFLLQLRFAKHCLETAIQTERFTVLKLSTERQSTYTQRRMRALRLKLLQIMNSFHVYIMNTFIVPTWHQLAVTVDTRLQLKDFTDFIHHIHEPFKIMARGCLQTDELTKFNKAIKLMMSLGIRTGLVDSGHCRQRLEELEVEYKRLVDFISAMFKGLSHMGITINGLDMSAFT